MLRGLPFSLTHARGEQIHRLWMCLDTGTPCTGCAVAHRPARVLNGRVLIGPGPSLGTSECPRVEFPPRRLLRLFHSCLPSLQITTRVVFNSGPPGLWVQALILHRGLFRFRSKACAFQIKVVFRNIQDCKRHLRSMRNFLLKKYCRWIADLIRRYMANRKMT